MDLSEATPSKQPESDKQRRIHDTWQSILAQKRGAQASNKAGSAEPPAISTIEQDSPPSKTHPTDAKAEPAQQITEAVMSVPNEGQETYQPLDWLSERTQKLRMDLAGFRAKLARDQSSWEEGEPLSDDVLNSALYRPDIRSVRADDAAAWEKLEQYLTDQAMLHHELRKVGEWFSPSIKDKWDPGNTSNLVKFYLRGSVSTPIEALDRHVAVLLSPGFIALERSDTQGRSGREVIRPAGVTLYHYERGEEELPGDQKNMTRLLREPSRFDEFEEVKTELEQWMAEIDRLGNRLEGKNKNQQFEELERFLHNTRVVDLQTLLSWSFDPLDFLTTSSGISDVVQFYRRRAEFQDQLRKLGVVSILPKRGEQLSGSGTDRTRCMVMFMRRDDASQNYRVRSVQRLGLALTVGSHQKVLAPAIVTVYLYTRELDPDRDEVAAIYKELRAAARQDPTAASWQWLAWRKKHGDLTSFHGLEESDMGNWLITVQRARDAGLSPQESIRLADRSLLSKLRGI